MNTLTTFFNPNFQDGLRDSQYEVIENELLKSCDLKNLTVSGSLFSLTTFINVTFRSCVFFGTKIENCKFINCKFENCSFQFSTLTHSEFEACDFIETHWDTPSIRKCSFYYSKLDTKTEYFIAKNTNTVKFCSNPDLQSQEENTAMEEATSTLSVLVGLPPIPTEEEQAQSQEGLWMSLWQRMSA